MFWTIRNLYLVEYAHWNSQAKIGYGCGNNSSVGNMGYTDNMKYHTGTTQANRTTYGLGTQYRGIEGLWDNVQEWCDGIYFAGSNARSDVYCIVNPANFSDGTGGTYIGTRATSGGFISKFNQPTSGWEWALYPSEVNGTEDTYICNYCYHNNGGTILNVGGAYENSLGFGLFCLNGYNNTSSKNGKIGLRLMVLP
jgi:hypothetical protein